MNRMRLSLPLTDIPCCLRCCSALQHLAAAHNERGIKAEWYYVMGLTLVYAVRVSLGPDFAWPHTVCIDHFCSFFQPLGLSLLTPVIWLLAFSR
jgi:hypothetical protein